MNFDEFRRQLIDRRGPRVENLVCLRRTASTNSVGRRIAGEYLNEGLPVPTVLIVALEQTGGRGRWGRRWESPAGKGVYASLVLPLASQDELATLPLLAAVGLARAVNRHLAPAGGALCRLKWPNDLLVGGRKLAGVLIESCGENDLLVAVVGFGLNHGQGEDELAGLSGHQGGRPATSLRLEMDPPPPLAALACELGEAVQEQLDHLGDAGYAAELYAELSLHRPGDRLCCHAGEGTVEGTFLGFDRRGFLRLEVAGREMQLAAGEVATA